MNQSETLKQNEEQSQNVSEKKKLAIVAMNAASCVGTYTYLHSIFGSFIDIEPVRLAAASPQKLSDASCVLYTSNEVKDSLPFVLPATVKELVCVRTFNHTYLHRIFQIPPDSFVCLVNDTEANAYAVIRLLQNFGFSQYHFMPWYPGCGAVSPEIRYAVTPGETRLVPQGVPTVIDIGNRIPDISTVNEIIALFGLPSCLADEITKNYTYHIVQTIRLSNLQLRRSLESQRLSQTIISNISDGLCLTDQNHTIQMANPAFSRLLCLTAKNLSGQNLYQLFSDSGIFCDLETGAELTLENARREPIRLWFQQVSVSREEPSLLIHASKKAAGPEGGSKAQFTESTDARTGGVQSEKNEENGAQRGQTRSDKKQEGYPRVEGGGLFSFSQIITENPEVRRMVEKARRISLNDFHVIIQGESGTEKEMLAQAIHRNSRRHRGPFLCLSLPAVDEAFVKRELLGWEEGFFPGRNREQRAGLLEQANAGTLFINNIQFMPLSIQSLLLHVLETGSVTRLGASRPVPVDFRIIASASRDLFPMVTEGQFLDGLFFAINSVSLSTIPLRQRKEDIFLLFDYFCRNVFNNPSITARDILSESVLRFLKDYAWPGNAQELNNLCKFFFCVYDRELITMQSLPRYMINQLGGYLPSLEHSEYQVLSMIRRSPRAGRGALKDALEDEGVSMSEGKIRSVMNSLAEKGLITVHRTRGGCEITEDGLSALQNQ